MEQGLAAVASVLATCVGTITDNALLMALFCTSLVGAGFGLVGRAKNSVL